MISYSPGVLAQFEIWGFYSCTVTVFKSVFGELFLLKRATDNKFKRKLISYMNFERCWENQIVISSCSFRQEAPHPQSCSRLQIDPTFSFHRRTQVSFSRLLWTSLSLLIEVSSLVRALHCFTDVPLLVRYTTGLGSKCRRFKNLEHSFFLLLFCCKCFNVQFTELDISVLTTTTTTSLVTQKCSRLRWLLMCSAATHCCLNNFPSKCSYYKMSCWGYKGCNERASPDSTNCRSCLCDSV